MNYVIREAYYKVGSPIPEHDFTAFKDTELYRTIGLVAASQQQLVEQINSKSRLDPNAKEIRYFYYEVERG